MTRIGLIGAGNIARTIAQLAAGTGLDLVLSNSRGPQTLAEQVARLGDHARAGTVEQAAASDLVVVTIPLGRLAELVREHPELPRLVAGTVVMDTMNYYPERDGAIEALDQGSTTTSELTAATLPDARVVKVFNNIVHSHLLSLARPHGSPERSVLAVATDDAGARQQVFGLLDQLGYEGLDAGTLADGWRFENGQPAYCLPYAADQAAMRRRRPGGLAPAGRQVVADEMAAALRAAVRP